MTELSGDHYVYLYREPSSLKPRYVGYGMSPTRALSHPGNSHNVDLRNWLEADSYDLQIAGPYRDRQEGLNVEAALISSLTPTFNRSPGDGPKFRPIGVPGELADRLLLDPITEAEVGLRTGGAMAVYLAPGSFTVDGRTKLDPARPDTEAIALNAEAWWQVDRHIEEWRIGGGPRVLVGVYGPLGRRFIVGSFVIDTTRWGEDPQDNKQGSIWRVPLADRKDADAAQLRGQRVTGIKFGRPRWDLYKWIDGSGTTRHPRSS